MVKKILGLVLVVLILINMAVLAKPSVDKDARSAEVLIENAESLQRLIEVKLEIIHSLVLNITTPDNVTTYINDTINVILEYKAEGDTYLNISKTLYEEGNYTGAKIYAIKAMQSYSLALKVIHELSEVLGIKFEECCVKERVMNRTRTGMANNSLIVALKIAEIHVDRLMEIIEKLDETEIDYDFEALINELNEIKVLIEEGKTLAEAGNVTEAAHILGGVRKRIAHVNAELHKISALLTVVKIKKFALKKFGENATMIDYIFEELLMKFKNQGMKNFFAELKKAMHEILSFKGCLGKGKKFEPPVEPPSHPGGGENKGKGHKH
ncbi:MAG: hypothetical protein DRJ38_08860 [Thermoprotei archaeon]|mgnify:CR=1 FL=1|nr:MAG: hypothetical protein DRJ38_08860 [Thermoprotei archaeon]